MKLSDFRIKIKDLKTGIEHDVKEIDFVNQEVIIKTSDEKTAEIIAQGGHHCSNCDPESPDWIDCRNNEDYEIIIIADELDINYIDYHTKGEKKEMMDDNFRRTMCMGYPHNIKLPQTSLIRIT